jgi:hypothetical protein
MKRRFMTHARMCTDVSDGAPQQERGNKCDHSYLRSPADHIETGGLASSQPPRRAAHDHAVVALDNISQDMYEQHTTHTPRFPSSTPKVASAHSLASVSGLSTSMDNLVMMYHCASTSGWSLSLRIARIASKSALNSSDIDHRCSGSNMLYFGQVRLNQPFFLSTEKVVQEMQQILTAVLSFTERRPVCFLVNPHGVLMGIFRGTSCVEELQVAWQGLVKGWRLHSVGLLSTVATTLQKDHCWLSSMGNVRATHPYPPRSPFCHLPLENSVLRARGAQEHLTPARKLLHLW